MKAVEDDVMFDKGIYQSGVVSFLYLSKGTTTRPDIAFAVGNVARFSANPTHHHWTGVKRILQYLKDTPTWDSTTPTTEMKIWLTQIRPGI